MKFSRRPQPMNFGDTGPQFLEPNPPHEATDALGFRPLGGADLEHPIALHGAASQSDVSNQLPHDGGGPQATATPPPAWPIWLIAAAVSILWAVAPIAFAVGYRANVAPLQNDAFALAVFALLAIGPAAFVLGAAYLIRQGQKLAFEARRSKAMAEDMLLPALIAAARSGDVALTIREEFSRAGAAADEARSGLLALRESLAFETDKLMGATAQSLRTAEELTGSLGRERTEMAGLAQVLDAQAARVTDAVAQQARMVTDAAGVAESQIREAETTLAARAADLAAAATETSNAARVAGEDLTRHIARLESAGSGVSEQVRSVETGLTEQRVALVALGQGLKADHDAFSKDAGTHAAQLAAFVDEARRAAEEMNLQAVTGSEALTALLSDATLQFRDLAETAQAERDEFGQATAQSLEDVSAIANAQRADLEVQTLAAIEALSAAAQKAGMATAEHAAKAREEVDNLAQAAFNAGQQANKTFEARLEEARSLVEHSAKLVDDASAASARRLDEGVAAARATLDELLALMATVEDNARRLPDAARDQAEQVRTAIGEGMEKLLIQARRTADEAKAIDVDFQNRVQSSAQTLSEAVRLMDASANVLSAATENPAGASASGSSTPDAADIEILELDEAASSPPAAEPTGAVLAERLGLRNRIRLTPTATDREFTAIFETAAGSAAPALPVEGDDEASEGWTWRNLLASLDGADGDGDGERLSETLGAELVRMGIDSERLLPRVRVEEVAAAVQTGDIEGAREVVRKLAPAATRRIARRLFTDEEIKRKSETYIRRYKTMIRDASVRDPEGLALSSLLMEVDGRIFLLLDAAAGDML